MFGGVFEAVWLSLAFRKLTVKCCVQDLRMVADNLFMNSERIGLSFFANDEGNKGIWISEYRSSS